MMWFVWPTSNPANLADRLQAQGLVLFEEQTCMEIDLTAYPGEAVALPGLEIRRVDDAETLKVWMTTFFEAFGLPDFLDEACRKSFSEYGFKPDAEMQNFLAYQVGKPVASSTLLCGDGIAAVYDVSTLPEVRGRGIGLAVTRAALLRGRAKGYKVAVLQATDMGYNIYHKLGYTGICKLSLYMWMKEETAE